MKKSILLVMLLLVSMQSYAIYVDPETLANDKARSELLQKLKIENKYNCNLNTYDCISKYTRETRKLYPYRGESYAKDKYSKFTKDQAFQRLAELADIYQKASENTSLDNEHGVVTQKDIKEEGWYLFSKVLRFDKNSPVWRDFYSDKQKKTAGYLPSPFIDKNCNMLIESERDLQVSIRKKCPKNI